MIQVLVVIAVSLLGQGVFAQTTDSLHPAGVRLTGTVWDSLARTALPWARVQLLPRHDSVGAPRTIVTDSLGRFVYDSVARGRYIIGFFHALLDSLTMEPILREIEVADRPVRVDLSTPSPARVRAAFCGSPRGSIPPAALVGIIRDAGTGAPVAGASVIGEWTDLSFGRGRVVPVRAHRSAVSAPNGWFALCGVPGPGAVTLSASLGPDSTDHIDMQMPADGFLRREVHVGRVRHDNRRDPSDTARRFRGGEGRLSGFVWTTRAAPLSGAIVTLQGGSRTRTYDDGSWTLTDLPMGTRMIEIRALGYYPERRAVDVVPGAPPVNVMLPTLESVLDTVRIRALGPTGVWTGFEERRRASGSGRFITEDDIRKRAPFHASDLLRTVPGMKVEIDIRMRGAFSETGTLGDCTPTLFLDGKPIQMPFGMTPDDIDMWVKPNEIRAIEIYPDVPPPQFQVALSGCGSIVIWRKG